MAGNDGVFTVAHRGRRNADETPALVMRRTGDDHQGGRPMSETAELLCDECDGRIRKVNPPESSDRQRRFLEAYRQQPTISRAARLAGIHRATVHRWQADAAFSEAMRTAADEFFREHKARVIAAEAARERWRTERERQRRPMRCYHLARARAAKGR
jgi:hypothetical protein